jgi:hypothetical protein
LSDNPLSTLTLDDCICYSRHYCVVQKNQRKTSKTELETIFLFSLSPEHLVRILIGAIKS